MDVSLILTHRCNLACGYCYAGEHHKTDIDDDVLRRAVELLYSDNASHPRLSFFGGEPFLAFEAMQRATALAEAEAARLGKPLTLQCTTNGSALKPAHLAFVRDHGVHVTVSIDGIREAHDLNRPCGGGKPSFDQVLGGLRALLEQGSEVDAMMVITPETAEFAYLSANFLWSEGVDTVRANVDVTTTWSDAARAELREQLVSIGWEMLARRLRGEKCSFKPFERAMRSKASAPRAARQKVVVGTSGNLYPCAPMVGEDRDDGPEAALRLGHLDDGAEAIKAGVQKCGVSCDTGKRCDCAAYLETGDRNELGRMGAWYGMVCSEIGASLHESLAQHPVLPIPRRKRRRGFLVGLAAVVGGAAVGVPLLSAWLARDPDPRPCELQRWKNTENHEQLAVPGEMSMPEPPPPPPVEPEVMMEGEMAY